MEFVHTHWIYAVRDVTWTQVDPSDAQSHYSVCVCFYVRWQRFTKKDRQKILIANVIDLCIQF